jgi:hypothetical protein
MVYGVFVNLRPEKSVSELLDPRSLSIPSSNQRPSAYQVTFSRTLETLQHSSPASCRSFTLSFFKYDKIRYDT